MRRIAIGILTLIASAALAAGAQPSEASVKELLQLSGTTKAAEMTKSQLAAMQNGGVQSAVKGHSLTPEVRKIVEASGEKVGAILDEALKWETIEPIFVGVYQSTMTQEEVDGIVAFYKTPPGQAMVQKMPALMQASGQRMQQQLAPVMEKLKQLQQETFLQLQAEFAKQN